MEEQGNLATYGKVAWKGGIEVTCGEVVKKHLHLECAASLPSGTASLLCALLFEIKKSSKEQDQSEYC